MLQLFSFYFLFQVVSRYLGIAIPSSFHSQFTLRQKSRETRSSERHCFNNHHHRVKLRTDLTYVVDLKRMSATRAKLDARGFRGIHVMTCELRSE